MAWNHVFWNMGKMEFPPETSVVSHTIAFQAMLAKKNRSPAAQQGECDNFLVCDEKQMVLDPWGRSKGATHTVLFSHSRKLAHSRGGIILYRWNYIARNQTGSSIICVPRFCCEELFAGPQRCQERWGWRCWWKASQACQNISWTLMNWVLRSWKV